MAVLKRKLLKVLYHFSPWKNLHFNLHLSALTRARAVPSFCRQTARPLPFRLCLHRGTLGWRWNRLDLSVEYKTILFRRLCKRDVSLHRCQKCKLWDGLLPIASENATEEQWGGGIQTLRIWNSCTLAPLDFPALPLQTEPHHSGNHLYELAIFEPSIILEWRSPRCRFYGT